jgi:DNA-directed RNA polymerase subunit beta
VNDAAVTDEIHYLSAIEEGQFMIAAGECGPQREEPVHRTKLVSCRHRNEFTLSTPDRIEYMDVAPSQAVSVARR